MSAQTAPAPAGPPSQLPLGPASSAAPAASPSKAPHGERPDLAKRFKLKRKYGKLQRKFHKATALQKDLELEAAEKEEKVQRLQDEVNLILDQIYASDYAHLAPREDSFFSDEDDEDEVEPAKDGAVGAPTSQLDAAVSSEGKAEGDPNRIEDEKEVDMGTKRLRVEDLAA